MKPEQILIEYKLTISFKVCVLKKTTLIVFLNFDQ